MGWFSSLRSGYAKVVTGIAKPIVTTISKVTGRKATPMTSQQLLKSKFGGTLATAGAGVATALAVVTAVKLAPAVLRAAPRYAPKVAKALVPTTIKGKLIGAVALPVIAGAVIKAPKETAKAIIKAPAELGKFGADVAGLITDPSVESAKELIKESPLITAGLGVAAVVVGGKAVAGVVSSAMTKAEMKKQTEALQAMAGAPAPATQLVPEKTMPTDMGMPIIPQTTTITTGKKPYRRRRATKPQQVRQSVRINILNRPVSTGLRVSNKYLNSELLIR